MSVLRNKIQTILREEDIEGFIESGAPSDEYGSEAKEIADALEAFVDNEWSESNITAVISLIWARSFSLSQQDMEKRLPAIWRIVRRILG